MSLFGETSEISMSYLVGGFKAEMSTVGGKDNHEKGNTCTNTGVWKLLKQRGQAEELYSFKLGQTDNNVMDFLKHSVYWGLQIGYT